MRIGMRMDDLMSLTSHSIPYSGGDRKNRSQVKAMNYSVMKSGEGEERMRQ